MSGEGSKTAALLIVFTYQGDLPWAAIDLYLAIHALSSRVDKFYVITDLTQDAPVQELLPVINKRTAKSDILTFLSRLATGNHELSSRVVFSYYSNWRQLWHTAETVYSSHQMVWFYYSGHMNAGHLKLPGILEEPLDIKYFRLLAEESQVQRVWFILDACEVSGLQLPFRLEQTTYRLVRREERVFSPIRIVCLAASLPWEKSGTTRQGSLFSQIFFHYLTAHRRLYLPRLLRLIQEAHLPQTPCIWSSHPDLYDLIEFDQQQTTRHFYLEWLPDQRLLMVKREVAKETNELGGFLHQRGEDQGSPS